MKWYDYGIMSASFYDIASDKAIRISQRQDVPRCPKGEDVVAFFNQFSDAELFHVHEVELPGFMEYDLPGKPRKTQICKRCAGERVYYVEGAELSAEQIAAGV